MKKRIKHLKRLAVHMPPIYQRRKHTEQGSLKELHALAMQGHNFTDKLPELTDKNENRRMTISYVALDKISHFRRLKRAYSEKYTLGVQQYIRFVDRTVDRWNRENPRKQVEEMHVGIYDLGSTKERSFWAELEAIVIELDQAAEIMDDLDEKAIERLEAEQLKKDMKRAIKNV